MADSSSCCYWLPVLVIDKEKDKDPGRLGRRLIAVWSLPESTGLAPFQPPVSAVSVSHLISGLLTIIPGPVRLRIILFSISCAPFWRTYPFLVLPIPSFPFPPTLRLSKVRCRYTALPQHWVLIRSCRDLISLDQQSLASVVRPYSALISPSHQRPPPIL